MRTDQQKAANPLAGLTSLVVLGFIAYQVYTCNHVGSGDNISDADRAQPLYQVSAQQLFEMYERNEVATDAEIKGKTIVVTGTIESIDENITRDPVVKLSTSDEFHSVDLELAAGQERVAAGLAKGQMITISCASIGTDRRHADGVAMRDQFGVT